MAKCSGCDASLSDSLIAEEEGEVYKSCPSCSERVGHHVFYRYDDFGMRDMRYGRWTLYSAIMVSRLPIQRTTGTTS
ncbi:Uncharacterised protein [Yersinia enterocolitica]|nr:Uncharacterised protein [Yersinia enterocolitica]CQH71705.1 Uncharacterised protein [Yersinia enterocolitica]CQQ79956.1 Uncharacterised protein [Yersinia enterocolitica]